MVLLNEKKKQIVDDFKIHSQDTGSAQVQVALLTERINLLTEHFKAHKKDFHSRRGLIAMTSKRRKLLDYLKKTDLPKYNEIIKKLNLRR